MISADRFDESGYITSLAGNDPDRFRELYEDQYSGYDRTKARQSYKNTFETTHEQKYNLFRDVVNAFSSRAMAQGSNSGFETTMASPLYEYGLIDAEMLLAKKQSNSVHICFVACDSRPSESNKWKQKINKISELLNKGENRQRLKEHMNCSRLPIRTVQYITFVKDTDLIDVSEEVACRGISPDDYAIWALVESKDPRDDSREIKYRMGSVSHPDLHRLSRQGIDPRLVDNDDIMYSLSTHPVFVLRDICLEIYLKKMDNEVEPKEFTKQEFIDEYVDRIDLGDHRSRLGPIKTNIIDNILSQGIEWEVLNKEDARERDYRIMWGTEDPGDIKEMVKSKYIDYKTPMEMGKLAFKRAREKFKPKQQPLDKN